MKLLYITSLSGKRINGFMRSAIVASQRLDIDFTIACNTDMADKKLYQKDCLDYGIKCVHIDFDRNPLSSKNLVAKQQLTDLLNNGHYDCVHCNTPIGGVLGRICASKAHVPYTIYQAHGFHFWKGAPLKNWILYYPVERWLAHFTNCLITINMEDYERARNFRLKKDGVLVLIHGIGIDTNKYSEKISNRELRSTLGIPNDAYVFITVGELIKRKNHMTSIKAFNISNIENSYLLICGDGVQKEELQGYIEKERINNVKLLGFRSDIADLLTISDCFVFPSFQEGLPGALMEAIASGLPCLASDIRGNRDLIKNNDYLFNPRDYKRLASLMVKVSRADMHKEIESNKEYLSLFGFDSAVNELEEIYKIPMNKARNM